MKPTLFLLFCVILVACSRVDDTPPGVIGDWVMTDGTVAGVPLPIIDGHRITISFSADGSVGGVAACNSFGGSYVADGEDVIIGDELASTAMACGEPGVMESEQTFLSALRGPLTYVRAGDELTIEGDAVAMTFSAATPVPQADLVDTRWTLETLTSGETARSAQGDATLLLTSDGRVIGSTGCRGLTGEFAFDGDTVLFTTFAAEGQCPADLANQDGFVVTVLGDGFAVTIDGDRLTVTSRGNEGLVYRQDG